MSEAREIPAAGPEDGIGGTAAEPASREKESGRVAFDARGNPVWEWRTGDATFQRDASTTLVRKLEAPDLSIEATAIVRRHVGGSAKVAAPACGGFDPYDSGVAPASGARPANRAAPARPPMRTDVSPPRGMPGLLQKLRSWVGGRGSSRPR
jgi:hypothetical protein